jgi:hypothetical protein
MQQTAGDRKRNLRVLDRPVIIAGKGIECDHVPDNLLGTLPLIYEVQWRRRLSLAFSIRSTLVLERIPMKNLKRILPSLILPVIGLLMTITMLPSPVSAQIDLGGHKDKDKKKEEEKPQFPHQKFKGTILTIKLEERRFLLSTPDGLVVLVQIGDKTKIKRRKEKKSEAEVLFADLKKGDAVEVSGQLPPTRILEAEKIYLEPEVKK